VKCLTDFSPEMLNEPQLSPGFQPQVPSSHLSPLFLIHQVQLELHLLHRSPPDLLWPTVLS
jgi:hypothetical protein